MALPMHAMRDLVRLFVKDAAPQVVRQKMQKAVPGIVKRMTEQGLTPGSATLKVLVRDALFKLWRVVIPSGTIADVVRDSMDDKVVDLVFADLQAGEDQELVTIVESTMEASLDVAF